MGFTYNEGLRIILLGVRGSGKSRTGNCLLGRHGEHFDFRSSLSTPARIDSYYHNDIPVSVVESPTERIHCFDRCLYLVHPGPHFFVLCCKMERSTYEFKKFFSNVEEYFGRNIYNFMIIAFTHFDQWRDDMIELGKEPDTELFIRSLPKTMTQILKNCNERFMFLDNRQTGEMLEKQSLKLRQDMFEIKNERDEKHIIYKKSTPFWTKFCRCICCCLYQ